MLNLIFSEKILGELAVLGFYLRELKESFVIPMSGIASCTNLIQHRRFDLVTVSRHRFSTWKEINSLYFEDGKPILINGKRLIGAGVFEELC
jgi:hypothetical protein